MSRTNKALLVSIALHAALLWTVISIRYGNDGVGAPPVVRVTLVRMPEAAQRATDAAAADETTQTGAAESVPASATGEPPRDAPPPAPRAAAPAAPPPAAPRAAARPPQSPQPPVAETETPAPTAVVATETETPAPTAPTAPAPTAPTAPAPTAPTAPTAARSPEPPVPATETPAPEQRRMLEDKAAEWAASLGDGELAPSTAWAHDGQDYRATFTRVPAKDSLGLEHVVVAVSTERQGSRWSTEMRLQRLAFSSFAQLIDRWDPSVQIHDDEIDGRFHSNSEIYVASSGGVQPAFHGKVTTARGVNTSHSQRRVVRSDVFLGGLETRAGKISLPSRYLPLPGGGDASEARVRQFAADTRITFYADGTYGWASVEPAAPEQRVALTAEPHVLVGAPRAALYVRGVVDGQVLVYSPEAIVIEDDLIYAADPVAADVDDYLGLVSDKNVEIAEPATTGPGDLTVHASIYAKRRFVVRNYRHRDDATLVVYGSVAAGSLSATEPRFRTKLKFDPRLENARPPRFPLTDRYELTAWNGTWTLEPDAD
jgi:hypothetical protein